jgi:hypothetical protein
MNVRLFLLLDMSLLLEQELCHLIEAAAPGKELMSCSLRNIGYSVVSGSLEVYTSLVNTVRILL